MTVRMRLALAILGILVILASFALMIYAFMPNSYETEQVPVAPTLFVPPQSHHGGQGAG